MLRILASFFKPAARYPADPRAVFVLAFSAFVGIAALAIEAAPESLNSLLPHWGVFAWGCLLVVGSLVALLGMSRQSLNGILLEQVGSVAVGVTTIFYSIIAIWFTGFTAMQTVGIILAWGLACLLRWGQLQALIINSYHEQIKNEAVREAVEQAIEEAQGSSSQLPPAEDDR